MAKGDQPSSIAGSSQSYSMEQIITIAVTMMLLVLAIVFVVFFKRRRV